MVNFIKEVSHFKPKETSFKDIRAVLAKESLQIPSREGTHLAQLEVAITVHILLVKITYRRVHIKAMTALVIISSYILAWDSSSLHIHAWIDWTKFKTAMGIVVEALGIEVTTKAIPTEVQLVVRI